MIVKTDMKVCDDGGGMYEKVSNKVKRLAMNVAGAHPSRSSLKH